MLTYEFVGLTASDAWDPAKPPTGFRAYEGSAWLGTGDRVWAEATTAVMHWAVKTRSGFVIRDLAGAEVTEVALGQVRLIARIGPFRITEPAEVVAIVRETDCVGFAYGTHAGHPVSGEEAFLVSRAPDGTVHLQLRSLTAAPRGKWRAAFALALIAQRFYRRRYLRALTR